MSNSKAVEVEVSAAQAKAPKKAEVVSVGKVLTWTFNGGGVASIDLEKLTPEMVEAAAMHGLKQTISDAYSGEKDGKMCHALASVRIDTLLGGSWTARSTGGGTVQSDLIAAVMEIAGKTVEEVTTMVSALDDAQVKTLKKNPKVAAVMARLQAERLAKVAGMDSIASDGLDALFGVVKS